MIFKSDPDAPRNDDEALDIVLRNVLGLADEPPCAANEYRQSPLHRLEMLMQNRVKEMRRTREVALISARGRGAYCECLLHRTGDYLEAFFQAVALMHSQGEIP